MIRTTLFWLHFACGVLVALVVLMMSVTGIVLTYERQLLDLEERSRYRLPAADERPLALEEIVDTVSRNGGFVPRALTLRNDPAAPVLAREGRAHRQQVDAYSGELMPQASSNMGEFFSLMTRWHRWFDVHGEHRATARLVTGISNLAFGLMILTGLYLWLPKVFKYRPFRNRLWFTRSRNSAARDFNWHHVFGLWFAIPLLVIVASGAVFGFSFANALVYRLAGEEPPQRGPGQGTTEMTAALPAPPPLDAPLPLATLARRAAEVLPAWNTMTVEIPDNEAAETVTVSLDLGNGGQPQRRHTLVLRRDNGDLVSHRTFADESAGRQARSYLRFLHTGEALGIIGQTVAGLASLASVLMVWTGLALAWRRTRRNWLAWRRRRAGAAAEEPATRPG